MKPKAHYFLFAAIILGGFLIHSIVWLTVRDCPKPLLFRVSNLHGRVVGRDLWLVQYRWFRRRFEGKFATLSLYRMAPPPLLQQTLAKEIHADEFGGFDFGPIEPGDYELGVKLATSEHPAQRFKFTIEPGRYSGPVLIDDSFDNACSCMGRDVEFK